MKVLNISTFDTSGGAARAAYRLHVGLQNIGVDSKMLVRAKSSDNNAIIVPQSDLEKLFSRFRANLNSLPLYLYPQAHPHTFSAQWFPDGLFPKVSKLNPDIIHLHWISNGFLQIETIANFRKPVVWTLMDMWAFTGGCHYSQECPNYQNTCGTCPQLFSNNDRDLSRKVWQRKAKAWEKVNLTVVAPSSWLAKCARSSSLFKDLRVEVIPFCLDTKIYKPIEKKVARAILNLPQNKKIILFGAISATTDQRKGFRLLQPALQKLSLKEKTENLELLVFGASKPEHPVDLGFSVRYLGNLKDDVSLSLVYSAADVMVVPSTQEAFGQTASESIACGTPVVAFDETGLADIVEHQRNGYLAKPFEIEDLAKGIAWVLENQERHKKLCDRAREKAVQEFPLELQALRYLSLYTELLDAK
jgi:glycosyltransferase involved in cell wall biosynthesis